MTNIIHRRIPALAVCAAALLALQGCSTYVSNGLADDGKSASQVVFPSIEDNSWRPEGTFPNLDNLRDVGPGLTKPQLYDLLGAPHFNEGIGAREWDYVLNFRSSGAVTVCQYKVIYDTSLRAQSFYWKPGACADMLNVKAAAAPPVATAAVMAEKPAPRQIQLATDALFAFDRSGVADLLPDGKRQLDGLAASLARARIERVNLVGHTDRLGSAAYNQQLSIARASTVRAYLMSTGLPSDRIFASGRGESAAVVQCLQTERAVLIKCLAPNRRVAVSVQGAEAK